MTASIPQLPLRDELFLLGHNDDTGQPHIHRQALALGMAGAVLIDLFLAGRIVLDDTDDARSGGNQRLRLRHDPPVGDLIADTAIASVRYANPAPMLRGWLSSFADDLYERTRAGLHAGGILRHTSRRRLGGLARREVYLATDSKWAVVARARLRYLAAGREPPDNHTAALAGLVAVLGLTTHLYLDDTKAVTGQLRAVAEQHHRPIREITAAVDAAVGDLATAAYR
ncbi:Golgi phosphoprotein 3 (GPP34) [Micromonospora purpureochromogenes]|uniref:Golgi phosphoprotein 3 (GPP34) n=1 Tax=Micromonospora purpureochromogenes TaxID=47872 RepID=A0A1C4UBU8_9ACTN|nr:GPP34 family phosphoprotein [Micromonospora purpureochromogenes]SCE69163.1 Golgi phosphoprotein 3 (GPP34) [Micromonospora purpureochromogenes]